MAADTVLDPAVLFRGLKGSHGLILAVSGGPDSTALMTLVARWSGRPPALVVTVDHGLRPAAADEAAGVAANAMKMGLASRIMRAPPREDAGNLQDWARRARYRCLAEAAHDIGYDTIVTAHHLEDQAETFLLRLARGSGVYGLAGMAGEGMTEGLRLARPLLGVPRSALAAVAGESGLAIADDPSNDDPRYDRVRMRRLMPVLAEHGLGPDRLAGTAARLRRAATALDHYTLQLLREHFTVDAFGVLEGPAAALAEAPEEVSLRALARILQAVAGAEYTPGLGSIETLRAAVIAAGADDRMKQTLHGTVLSVDAGRLRAVREWGRSGIGELPAVPGSHVEWDRRFRVSVPQRPGRLSVRPLGRSGVRFLSNAAGRDAIRVLPGLFDAAQLVAIPEGITAPGEENLGILRAECLVSGRLAGSPDPARGGP